MKNLNLLIALLFLSSLFAQKTIEKEFKLSNGKKKNIKIFIPEQYEQDTINKYPVMVVLGDQYLFDLTKGNAKLFAEADIAPKQIVVGVPTDTKPNQDVSIVKQNLGLSRNAKTFFNFIKNDLLVYIKGTYKKTSPFITLVSQGKAADFATYFLSDNKPAFNAIIAITPNLSERKVALLNSYNLTRFDKVDNTYFIYMSSSPFQKQASKVAYKKLDNGLSSYEIKHLDLKFDYFKDTPNSMSVISESLPRAFSQIFSLYRNISKKEFEEKIKDLAPLEAIEYLEKKYIDIDYLYGTNTNVRLEDFYAIEGIVTDQQDGDYLRVLGDFALIKHPDSPLGDYYLGKFYEMGKQYKRADEYYRFGYGKMDPSDPNTDAFYKNIERVAPLIGTEPQEEPLPEEEPGEEEPSDKQEEEQNNQDNNDDE